MFWESSGVVGFDLGPLLEGQMTAKLKSAYNSLIIGPRGFGALSLRWIQFASVLRCARSSYSVLQSPSEIKNTQSADTVPVHGHSPLVDKLSHSKVSDRLHIG